jgi:hypothetical protein
VIKARNHGMTLFYRLFDTLMNNAWMFFRISPWGSLTAKNSRNHEREKHGRRDVEKNSRNHERGVMIREFGD